ncbi:hypothetical protein [Pectobacterium odoriferum]|uniref:hypothetical protein n=1 Tax=Pectobacterium odoriferum TaxID=78398 RepID=UPI000CD2BEF2|nr:hypothetical protein [Pectobacterium odoriferum]POE40246.1 hypothetical protein BV920_08800 [Pectobacterium odoriferum]
MKKEKKDDKKKDENMKENKDFKVTSRINELQNSILQKLITDGKAKTPASAIQYLINLYAIKGE